MAGKGPNDAPADSFRARLEKFYLEKNPSKLGSMTATLNSFEGHEEDLFRLLVDKYGPSEDEKGAVGKGEPEKTVPSQTEKPAD